MAGKKTIFIVPGYKHKPTQKAYKQLAIMLKKEGYFPLVMDIPWKKQTISENTQYFLKQYNAIRRKEKFILGFSYGAMIALLASTKVPTSGLILCSLSPYFKEDIEAKHIPLSDMSSKEVQDFRTLSCSALAKKVKTDHVMMLYGAKESKTLIRRVTQAFASIHTKQKYLVPVKKTQHNISDKRYLHSIHFAAQHLMYV